LINLLEMTPERARTLPSASGFVRSRAAVGKPIAENPRRRRTQATDFHGIRIEGIP
jgi:hypothetical protein